MIILQESNYSYFDAIGPNFMNGSKKHRFMKYIMMYDDDLNGSKGKVIYNYLLGAMIWIPYDQFNTLFTDETSDFVDWMWKNYFIVNNDFNEVEAVKKIRDMFKFKYDDPMYLKSGNINAYTIYTTTACNARCFYCYEKGIKQKPMTADTARKVGNYIIRTAVKNGNNIELRWFGGEPLVNENAIDIICTIVKDAGFNYTSSFTSNGFLFKPENLQKYFDLWHLTSGQITLDGTEEVYNKTKNYKNIKKGKSPYQIVMNNIKMLIDNNIHVAIRMNMDAYNVDNLQELVKEIHKKFGNNQNISPYCYPIFEDEEHSRTEEEIKILYENCEKIDKTLEEYGYTCATPLQFGTRITHCMVDSGTAVLIDTEGNIGLCEHYSDSHFWGHIDDPKLRKEENIKIFWNHCEPLELCKECPMHPICTRVELCADLSKCNKYKRSWNVRHSLEGIKLQFRNILDNINNQQNGNNNQRNNYCECFDGNYNNGNCNNGNCNNGNCENKEVKAEETKVEEIKAEEINTVEKSNENKISEEIKVEETKNEVDLNENKDTVENINIWSKFKQKLGLQ